MSGIKSREQIKILTQRGGNGKTRFLPEKRRRPMLLFDMDGTLIDSNGVWKNVDREFLARRGIAYTHAYYEGVAHTILPLAAFF